VRAIWRLYGGWWDGQPAHLKPPRERALGAEVATLAGGAGKLAERARELAAAGEHALACQLLDWAAARRPTTPASARSGARSMASAPGGRAA